MIVDNPRGHRPGRTPAADGGSWIGPDGAADAAGPVSHASARDTFVR